MSYTIILSPEARAQLIDLDAHITAAASPKLATRYVDAIVDFCYSLNIFPERGTRRDDIRLGVRITHYRKRAVIAFTVDSAVQEVLILGIFYGGQDYETALRDE